MLKLDDRLRIAMSNDMGCQLTASDVKLVAAWLVTLRRIAEGKLGSGANYLAREALGQFAPAVR